MSSAAARCSGTVSFAEQTQQERLASLCSQRGLSPHQVVASAWTLTLGEYTGAETVAFALQNTRPATSLLVQVKPEIGTPISQLVEGLARTALEAKNSSHEITIQPLYESARSSINTAVIYDRDRRSGFKASEETATDSEKYAIEVRLPEYELGYDGSLLSDVDAAHVAQSLGQALRSILGGGYDTVPVGDISLLGDEGRSQVERWNAREPHLWPVSVHQIVYQRVLEQPNAPAIQAPDGEYTYAQLDRAADRFARYLVTLGCVEPDAIIPFCFTKSAWAIVSVLAILKAGATAAALDPSYPPERLQQILSQTRARVIVSSQEVRGRIQQTAASQHVIAVDEWFHQHPEPRQPPLDAVNPGRAAAVTPSLDPSAAAFVFFTSGSTGKSKGIVLSHQSMCTSAFAHGAFMGLDARSRVLQFAAYTFDVSNQDIWTTLMHGGCVCVPSEDERLNDIAGAVNRMSVNWTFLTPTVARLLTPDLVPTLRTLVLGGEAVTKDNVDTWSSSVRLLNSYGPAECSICCAVSELSPPPGTQPPPAQQEQQSIDPANIGYALPSAVLWIANPRNHNVLSPIGAVGELLVEGPILARGYLHDPERTAAAFIEGPTWASAAETKMRRFYKTGDLVRYASDGTMRFVGRKDHQVKIRGQRTELGDIEHHLLSTASTIVKQGSVFLPKKGHWGGRLVAVVSLTELSRPSTKKGVKGVEGENLHLVNSGHHGAAVTDAVQTLHTLLSEKLPTYMIPAAWFVVEGLPLTASAKVDRKRILHWIESMDHDIRIDGQGGKPSSSAVVAGSHHAKTERGIQQQQQQQPGDENESILQQIWGRVLNIPADRVSLHQSFISVGGDSISAMQVMGEARVAGLALSVQEILSARSLVDLAITARPLHAAASSQGAAVGPDALSAAGADISSGAEAAGADWDVPFPLTPMQLQHFRLAPAGDSAFSQGFLLSLPHKVSVESLTDAVEALVDRHPMLRARFVRDGQTGAWTQHIAGGKEDDQDMDDDSSDLVHFHRVRNLDRIDAATQRARARLDVTSGPVFSVDLFDVRGGQDSQQQLVYILAHQLAVDLVSWRVLLQELEEFLRRGYISHPQPFSFSQWCRLQHDRAQILDAQKTLPWTLEPPDMSFWGLTPSTGHTYGSVVEERVRLDPGVSNLLLGQVPESLGVEPIDIFMAAIVVSLAHVFPDHFVPTLFQESHGRQPWDDAAIDLSRTVGWFTTMAPVPFHHQDGRLGVEALARKIHQTRKDMPDKGWANWTAKFLSPSRKSAAEPAAHELLEMVFNYEGIYQILEREDSWLRHGPPFSEVSGTGRSGPARAFGLAASKTKFRSDSVSLLAVFEITAAVVSSQIEFSFLYPPGIRHRSRVSRWVARVQETLVTLTLTTTGNVGSSSLSASQYPLSHHAAESEDSLSEALRQIGVVDASSIEDIYRCSPMQEGLLLSQSANNNHDGRGGTYVLNYIWEFVPQPGSSSSDRSVVLDRVGRAWESVVCRHPSLRTAFLSAPNGHIDQVVFHQRDVQVEHETIQYGDIKDQDLLLTTATLLRNDGDPLQPQHQLTLLETTDGGGKPQFFLKLSIHHTIFDGESAPILAREICAAYDGELEQRQPPPVPYVSLIRHLADRDSSAALAYWTNLLSDATPCHFPTLTEEATWEATGQGDRANISKDSHELVAIKLEPSTATLQKACARAGITLSTLFLTTWALVLRVYTGQESVSFGFLASGRDAAIPGIESIVGPVLNMLISHALVKASKTPLEVAKGIQSDFLQSLSHQFTPLAEIHRHLGQTNNHKSLFNTVLSYQRAPPPSSSSQDGTFQLRRIGGQSRTEYDITLNVDVAEEVVSVVFKYWTSSLSQAFAVRVAETFRAIVTSVTQDFDTPLDQRSLLSWPDGRDIAAWGDGGRAEPTECIHTLVKQRAIESPDAVAIRSWDIARLTYAELDAAASRLSYHLRTEGSGLGRGVLVPILAARSAWAIIGLVAVLKAGWAGYIIDPSTASSEADLAEKLAFAKHHIILATPDFVETAEKLVSFPRVIPLGGRTASSVYLSPDSHGFLDVATLDDMCSIIFTSGREKGHPRPVFLSHRNVVSRVMAHIAGLGLTASSSVLHHAPYTSHEGLGEVWSTLAAGASLSIPAPASSSSSYTLTAETLSEAINEFKVDWAMLTPSLTDTLDPASVPSLQTLVWTGEILSKGLYDAWGGSGVRLIQSYSAAEVGHVSSAEGPAAYPSNIGRPMKNTRFWIADPNNHQLPVPIGAVGALLIEGDTVSGILHPNLYASNGGASDKLVDRPSWATRLLDGPANFGPQRLFRTGDLVRYRPDGTLQYLSRAGDARLDLLEWRLLQQTTDVRQAVAIHVSQGPLERQLVVVYTTTAINNPLESSQSPITLNLQSSPSDLQHILQGYGGDGADSLNPNPTLLIPVQALPLLPTGKVDRRRVRKWLESLDQATQYREILRLNNQADVVVTTEILSDPTEDALAEIWSEVLHVPKGTIGRETPFYNLGGDSISAIQAASRGRRLKLNLTVQDILQHRTIARIAPVVARRQPVGVGTTAVVNSNDQESSPPNVPFGLAPIQSLFFDADPDGKQRYYQSQYLELKKPVSGRLVTAALRALVQRHPMLRARFSRDDDDEWMQSISDDVGASFMLGVVREAQPHDISDSIKAAVNSLDVTAGPLVASRLFTYASGGSKDVLFLAVHHLVVDHVSWRIILKELEDILLSGTGSLADEPTPYPFQQWSRLLTEYSLENLRRPDQVLPHDDFPGANTAFWGLTGHAESNTHGQVEQFRVVLDEHLTSRLLTQSQARLRTEPVDVMLGALLHAFVHVFPDRGIPAMFNESHGRDALSETCDISQTVGWFSTMAPLLPLLSPSGSEETTTKPLDTIRRVKDARQSLLGGGWQYFASRYLTPEGQAQFGHHYPMEIVFNYLGRYQGLEHNGDDSGGLFRRLSQPDVGCLYRDLPRFSLFEVLVSLNTGQLQVQLSYPKAVDGRHHIRLETWMKQYITTLQEVVKNDEVQVPPLALSDFPLLVDATYADLDRFAHEVLPTVTGSPEIGDVEDLYPSTPIQAGLLLSQAYNTAYYEYFTVAEVVLTPGSVIVVDSERLAHAWRDVVQRHAILRTVFVDSISAHDGGIYDQLVLRGLPVEVPQLRSGHGEDPSAVLRSLPGLEFRPGYALHRFSICTTDTGAVFVRLDINHAISDGASTNLLLRDLAAAYHGRHVPDGPVPAPLPAPQYREFVSFLLQNPKREQIHYWADRLKGIEPCLLPISPQKQQQQPNVAERKIHFTSVALPKTVASIRTFCIQEGITVSTLLQTAWAMVLRVYCNADQQVCFGYVVSGRDAPIEGVEDIVGPLLNLLVCKVPLDQSSPSYPSSPPTPRQILQHVQTQFVAGLAHQFCPLADVLHALGLGGQTLFNTAFSFQKRSSSSDAGKDGHIQFRRQRARDPTEFDMAVDAEDSGSDLSIVLEHWRDKISPELASNIADTYTQAILSILDHKDEPVRQLDVTGPGSLSKIHQWNHEAPPSHHVCIHHLFEEHARRRPDAPAICSSSTSGAGDLSYGELDTAATGMARRLRAHGVRRQVMVPFMLTKSVWSVVGILAILKAGGAAVPLDPQAPQKRLADIVSDTEALICLCSPEFQDRLSALFPTVVTVGPGSLDQSSVAEEIIQEQEQVLPSDPAFVIFTSGSTGVPKGSILEHGSLSTTAMALMPALDMQAECRVLHFAAYTFDVSIEEVCFSLMHGACICVLSEEERLNDLAGAMRRLQVTWADLTPTVAALITPQTVPSLKTLVMGGETLTRSVISAWAGREEVRLFNTYGPSECSVMCTVTRAPLTASAHGANIGSAVGSRAWVVDPGDHRLLVPVGAVGELVIEGRIVARGYLKKEDLSASRFLKSAPWLPEQQRASGETRLYRSGDLVRLHDDGSLIFIGRQDGQAKLHGQRLELGEIEHQVLLHQDHHHREQQVAVDVLPVPGYTARKALVAFLGLRSGTHDKTEQGPLAMTETLRDTLSRLKQRLSQALPPYMVPSVYIPLADLPHNTSGKTDRKALAALVGKMPEANWLSFGLAGTHKIPPATEPQRQLQRLWSEVLGLDARLIGQDDHFFQLGGDSVLTIHLAAAARKAGLSLSAGQILQHSTLSAMAASLTPRAEATIGDTLVPSYSAFSLLAPTTSLDELRRDMELLRGELSQDNVEDVYPCTPLQQGLLALTLRSQDGAAYLSRRTYLLPPTVDVGRFQGAWQRLVDETPILRTRICFTSSRAAAYQVVLAREAIQWFSSTTLEQYLADDDGRLVEEGEPLARYALIHQARGQVYFVWTIHHALYDGWSESLMLRRLVDIFHEEQGNQQQEQTSKLVPFRPFVQHLSELDVDAADQFWSKYLAEASTAPFPPRSTTARGEQTQPRGVQTLDVSLPPRQQQGQHVVATTATLLKVAWSLVFSQYADSTDVTFGLTLSGRDVDLADIDVVAGPTIATVPFRVRFDHETPVSALLARVQSETIEMMDHQHIGLQRIRTLGDEAEAVCDFQNLLVIQPGPSAGPLQTSLALVEVPEAPRAFTSYPLVLECFIISSSSSSSNGIDGGDRVRLQAIHDVGALSTEQTRRILHQLSTALQQLTSSSLGRGHQTVGDLELLSDYDRTLVSRWNRTPPSKVDRCVTDLIREQVLLGPDREAVRAWDASLTYGEVHDRANVLARMLIEQGVVPGTPVGFSLPRSSWSAVVLLGISLAGGAGVYVDSAYSRERIGHILSITGLKWLVATDKKTCHFFLDLGLVTINAATVVAAALANSPATSTSRQQQTELPSFPPWTRAQIVFTSGSTGVPKGVALSHTALSSSLVAHGKAIGMGRTSRMLHYSSYTFDISLAETFTTLALGGCLCVPSEEDRLGNIASAIEALETNMAIFTPTVARLLNPDDVPTLRTLILGGEAPQARDLARWTNHVSLMPMYGPAEAAMITSGRRPYIHGDDPLNIGHTLSGSNMWLVRADNHHRLAAVGTVGELLIEGPVLAEGYLGDTHKTAESFILDPDWARSVNPHAVRGPRRFYKTGDLFRYADGGDDDGSLLYVARKDTQIKINGQRVELGEIEHHVRESLNVAFPIVVDTLQSSCSNRSGGRRRELVVYVRPSLSTHDQQTQDRPGETPQLLPLPIELEATLLAVRDRLQHRLAAHMIPSLFVPLSFLPRTQNGKIDRRILQKIGQGLSQEQRASYSVRHRADPRPPSTPVEAALQQIWSQCLDIPRDQIGADDGFIQLGGDSLTAIQLVVAARSQNLTLSVQDVFRHPKLSEMAQVTRILEDGVKDETTDDDAGAVDVIKPFSLVAQGSELDDLLAELEQTWNLDHHEVEDIYPTTPLQEGLLAATMKARGTYVNREVYRVPESIDLDRFVSALEQLLQRHPVLRTCIVTSASGVLRQVVLRTSEHVTRVKVGDIQTYLKLHDPNSIVGQLGKRLATATVIEDDAGLTYFLWTAHHSVYDGWMMNLLWRELDHLYRGTMQPMVPRSFVYFVAHVNRQLNTSAADDFWRRYLAEAPPTIFPEPRASLPPTYQPLASESLSHTAYMTHPRPVGSTISTVIRAAWALVLASYADDRTQDVVFHVTQSGRNAAVAGILGIIGPTITTYPLRVRWQDGEATVRELLDDVQSSTLELIPYEHTGLQRIADLGADYKTSCTSNNLLIIHPANAGSAQSLPLGLQKLRSGSSGVRVNHDDHDDHGNNSAFLNYGLAVECTDNQEALKMRASYDPYMIPSYQVKRILHQLDSLIQQLCAATSSQQLVRDLDRISPADRQELKSLHDASHVQAVARSVPSVFADMVALAPDAPAVDSQLGLRLTYAELDRISNSLAHTLVSLGVDPDDKVAWCSSKSPWTIVGLLAIAKSGGTVIFLDPSHPPSRRHELLRVSQPRVILAISPHDTLFSSSPDHNDDSHNSAPVISLNVDDLVMSKQFDLDDRPLIPAPDSIQPHHGLYVQFTSGSTGTPKGCVVEHGSFLSAASVYTQRTRLDRTARVYQLSSYSFDISMMEILATLTVGGCVCVPREEARLDDLAASISSLRVSWATMTPSLARTVPVDGVPTLKDLVLAGEAVAPTDVARWWTRLSSSSSSSSLSSFRLYNGYGPAECSVLAHVNIIEAAATVQETQLQADELGSPIASRSWIVEPGDPGKLVPLGAVGELLIDGPIVGRGYLGDPQRTAAAFISPPQWLRDFSDEAPAEGISHRLYLTGDLVRYNKDAGSISYVGRKDTQVKIRGQRTELGEIEHRLEAIDGLGSAVVLYPRTSQGKDQLVAFVSLSAEAAATDNNAVASTGREAVALLPKEGLLAASPDLRRVESLLATQLPSYMVPTLWVPLASMPLLVSGKTNRRALLAWLAELDQDTLSLLATLGTDQEQEQEQNQIEKVSRPWTPVEKTLRSIWCKVLGLPPARVSLHSSFTRLGGNSISAMQVAGLARIAQLHLPMAAMIRAKTLEELATHVKPIISSSSQQAEQHQDARTITGKAFPLSPMQQLYGQIALGDDELSRSTDKQFHYSFPFRLTSRVSLSRLDEALRATVSRHPLLRARFRRERQGHVQEITDDVVGSYRLQTHQYPSVGDARPTLEASRTGLDIYTGPLVAADVVETAADQLLFLTIHHLATDMVSWSVILEELGHLLSSPKTIDDDDHHHHHQVVPPYPFQNWCQRQAEIAHTLDPATVLPFTTPDADFDYWQMGQQPNLLQDLVGAHLELDESRTSRLLELGEGIEAQDVLVAALLRSFHLVFPDRSPPPIFRYHHGRDAPSGHQDVDLSRTVGWLTTISPLHVPFDADTPLSALVRRTAETRSSIPDNGLPYFVSRFLTAEGAAAFRHHDRIEVLLNYFGSGLRGTTASSATGAVAGDENRDRQRPLEPFRAFSDSSEGGLGARGKAVRRFALVGIAAQIRDGRLVLDVEWNNKMGRQDQLARWTEVLRALLEDGL